MCDYTATGIWINGVCTDPKNLGLPPKICDDLKEWQNKYEDMYQLGQRRPSKKEVDEFNKQGFQIFLQVKEFLSGDKYEFEFFKESYSEETDWISFVHHI